MSKPKDYPKGWPEFARQVKEECAWKCERCGHANDLASRHVLTVHHLTNNKQQPFTDRWAFAGLCQRCHLKVQARVKMDQMFFADILDVSPWFKPHLEGYLASLKKPIDASPAV